jgi:uncharacterized OsmC-like protein
MSDGMLVSTVRSASTDVHGRTLNSAGTHHFIIDGPTRPNEEIVSMDAFLAGISSCATHLMEDFADEEGIRLDRVETTIRAERPADEPQRFDHIDLHIRMAGPSPEQADHLLERFKAR